MESAVWLMSRGAFLLGFFVVRFAMPEALHG
jgi:hypothetical protein